MPYSDDDYDYDDDDDDDYYYSKKIQYASFHCRTYKQVRHKSMIRETLKKQFWNIVYN